MSSSRGFSVIPVHIEYFRVVPAFGPSARASAVDVADPSSSDVSHSNHALERMTASPVIRKLDVLGSGHRSAWLLGILTHASTSGSASKDSRCSNTSCAAAVTAPSSPQHVVHITSSVRTIDLRCASSPSISAMRFAIGSSLTFTAFGHGPGYSSGFILFREFSFRPSRLGSAPRLRT